MVRLPHVALELRHGASKRKKTLETSLGHARAPSRGLELVRDGLEAVISEELEATHLLMVVPGGLVEDALERAEGEVVDGGVGVSVGGGGDSGVRAGVHVDGLSGAHGRDERRGRASAAGDGGGDGTRGRFRGGPVRVHEERAVVADDRAEGLETRDEHAGPGRERRGGVPEAPRALEERGVARVKRREEAVAAPDPNTDAPRVAPIVHLDGFQLIHSRGGQRRRAAEETPSARACRHRRAPTYVCADAYRKLTHLSVRCPRRSGRSARRAST